MKRLHFVKPNNLSSLHDELIAAMPTLRRVAIDPDGRATALPDNLRVEGLNDDIWLTVPDTADEVAIAAVVVAHNPAAPRPPLPLTAEQQAWANATAPQRMTLIAKKLGFEP